MSMSEADAQLPLKKRARRRLVGAIAIAVLAAVVLPMVMDQAPQAPVADVQIRIPGQDQVPAFNPKTLAGKPAEAAKAPAKPDVATPPVPAVAAAPVTAPAPAAAPAKAVDAPVATKPEPVAKTAEKPLPKPADKPADKPAEKASDKPAAKSPEKPADKPLAKSDDDSRRAAAILSGKPAEAPAAAGNGQYVVLIGAFANPANVKQLQTKLGEIGLKTFTEPLDSPQGKKTRLRAGPFANRDAAEKALEKMKRIGVSGVVAAKQ